MASNDGQLEATATKVSKTDNFEKYEYDYETLVKGWPILKTVDGKLPEGETPSVLYQLKTVLIALRIALNNLANRKAAATKEADGSKTELPDHLSLKQSMVTLQEGERQVDISPALRLAARHGWESVSLEDDKAEAEEVKSLRTILDAFLKKQTFDIEQLFKFILRLISQLFPGPKGVATAFDDYRELFRYPFIEAPDLAFNYHKDKIFANLRVCGFNPVVIKGIKSLPKNFPVEDKMLAKATGDPKDTLKAAGESERLYLTDYKILEDGFMGNFPAGPKYSYAPMALFALPKSNSQSQNKLVPVAIQVGQDDRDHRIVTPDMDKLWFRAKCIVQQADAAYHELVSHLAGCHLLMEPFAIATHNNLSQKHKDDEIAHPIGHLLTPHFEGTLSINDNAVNSLMAKGGKVDAVLGLTYESSAQVAIDSLTKCGHFEFNDRMLPRELKLRKVDNPSLYYPYRDDATLLWHAIQAWTTAYIGLFYKTNEDVQHDARLQRWAQELVSPKGGRLQGFGEQENGQVVNGKLTTISYLIDVVTMVIFTASAGHAVFNFGQNMMTFAPAVPGATYRAMPLSKDQADRMPEIDHLPPLEIAETQIEFLTLLGGVHYTQLGFYPLNWTHVQYKKQDYSRELKKALSAFQESLIGSGMDSVTSKIRQANANRSPTKFTLLLPQNIPQSVNI